MFSQVKRVVDEGLELDEIAFANSYLMNYQFVFHNGNGTDRKVFNLVTRYQSLFENSFELFGKKLVVDQEHGYIGFKPDKKRYNQISKVQSMILLALRIIYHKKRVSGNSDNGTVLISGSELSEVYKSFTDRDELTAHALSFETALKPIEQKRIIKLSSDKDTETDFRDIFILPSIQEVVDEEFAQGIMDKINRAKQEVQL